MTPTTWSKRFGAAKRASNDEKEQIAKGISKSTMETLRLEQERLKEGRLQTLRTSLRARKEREELTKEIEKKELNNAVNGDLKIVSASAEDKTNTTLVSRQQSSPAQVEICDLVGSESMKLIDESAKQLQERMTSSETVTEACMCADQIGKLIRLKFDIRRTERG